MSELCHFFPNKEAACRPAGVFPRHFAISGIKETVGEMEERGEGEMWKKKRVSHICLLMLAVLQITAPSSAQTTSALNPAVHSYRTRPADVTVAVGKPAVFYCGVPKASPNLTFTFYGSDGNYSLICPMDHVEDIAQALYGRCLMKTDESLAVWTLKGTSFSDNGTRVVCQQSNDPDAPAAVLHVYDNSASFVTLIGCVVGGFFGVLLVFGLLYIALRRSETLQKWFKGKDTEDFMTTIVTKD
ncbi:uncharacterized protein LOC116690955 [Etheostoma spectabile]|uniref:uncharacterized protein LOC116690955 n=1 Tax=Etheostoma spectabile TaxID=54343 RepID=UPI0013AF4542|nr:uncharacterized protein LOC116690955 [Etheostoma spectabile]